MNSVRFFLGSLLGFLMLTVFVAKALGQADAGEVLASPVTAEALHNAETLSNNDVAETDVVQFKSVQLKAWITQEEPIIATQQLDLNIEVAVPSWFTGGTKISHFEIDNMIVLRREKFAVNSTREFDDETWTVQVWTINLYPQVAGQYEIPRIELDVNIADEFGAAVERKVYTKPFVVNVKLPMNDDVVLERSTDDWVATSSLVLSESLDKSVSKLNVGDAFKRTIEINADNLAAMMLPELVIASQEGLAVYKEPTTLVDKANRGRYQASRREVFSFLVEKPGRYTLPAIEVRWWDLKQEQMRTEALPEVHVSTVGYQTDRNTVGGDGSATPQGFEFTPVRILIGALVAFVLALGAIVMIRFFARNGEEGSRNKPNHINQTPSLQTLQKRFRQHCVSQDYQQAEHSFRQWVDLKQNELGKGAECSASLLCVRDFLQKYQLDDSLRCYDALTKLAYGDSPASNDTDRQLRSEFETLIPQLERGLNRYIGLQKVEPGSSKILLN